MNCNTCEERFLCFTLPADARPLRITVNWNLVRRCGTCVKAKWVKRTADYGLSSTLDVGHCGETGMLVHKESAQCKDSYKPMKSFELEKLYKGLSKELAKKNRRGKLPKYCLLEE